MELISEAGGEGDYMSKAGVNGPDNTPNWEWGDPIMWEEFSSSQQQALTNAAGGIGGMQERLMNEGWSDYDDEEDSYESISNIINEADFKEEDHPRDKGKFTSKGGGDSGKKSKSTGISKDNLSSLKKDAKGNQDLYSLPSFDPQMHVDSKIYKKIHKDLGDPKMEDSSIDDKISSYVGGLKLDPNKKGDYMRTQFGESRAKEFGGGPEDYLDIGIDRWTGEPKEFDWKEDIDLMSKQELIDHIDISLPAEEYDYAVALLDSKFDGESIAKEDRYFNPTDEPEKKKDSKNRLDYADKMDDYIDYLNKEEGANIEPQEFYESKEGLDPKTTDITICVVCGLDIDNHSNPNTDYRGMRGDAPPTDHYFSGGMLGDSDDKLYFESYTDITKILTEGRDDPRKPGESEMEYWERTGQILSSRVWDEKQQKMVDAKTGKDEWSNEGVSEMSDDELDEEEAKRFYEDEDSDEIDEEQAKRFYEKGEASLTPKEDYDLGMSELEGKIDWEWNKLSNIPRKELAVRAGVPEEYATNMSRKQDWQDVRFNYSGWAGYVEDYMRNQGITHESYAKEFDSTCPYCGKELPDEAKSPDFKNYYDTLIDHMREEHPNIDTKTSYDLTESHAKATESSVNCTKCQTRIWDKERGYMNGTKEVKNDNGTVSVICGNCKNEVVSDGMGHIISGEVVPSAKDYWEEEGWKEAEWQWGLKGYSTNWDELTKEQQDNVTNKFNAMVDEDPSIFESYAKEGNTEDTWNSLDSGKRKNFLNELDTEDESLANWADTQYADLPQELQEDLKYVNWGFFGEGKYTLRETMGHGGLAIGQEDDKTRFQCQDCGYTTEYPEAARMHHDTSQGSLLEPEYGHRVIDTKAGESKSKCNDCGAVFDNYDPGEKIQKHVRAHKEKEGNNYEPDFSMVGESKAKEANVSWDVDGSTSQTNADSQFAQLIPIFNGTMKASFRSTEDGSFSFYADFNKSKDAKEWADNLKDMGSLGVKNIQVGESRANEHAWQCDQCGKQLPDAKAADQHQKETGHTDMGFAMTATMPAGPLFEAKEVTQEDFEYLSRNDTYEILANVLGWSHEEAESGQDLVEWNDFTNEEKDKIKNYSGEAKATEKGETYIFMWRSMDEDMRKGMLRSTWNSEYEVAAYKGTDWEQLPTNVQEDLKVKMNELFKEVGREAMYGFGSATGRMSPAEHWKQGLDAYGDMGYDSKLASPMYQNFQGMSWNELPEEIKQAYMAKHDYVDTTQTEALRAIEDYSFSSKGVKASCPKCGKEWNSGDAEDDLADHLEFEHGMVGTIADKMARTNTNYPNPWANEDVTFGSVEQEKFQSLEWLWGITSTDQHRQILDAQGWGVDNNLGGDIDKFRKEREEQISLPYDQLSINIRGYKQESTIRWLMGVAGVTEAKKKAIENNIWQSQGEQLNCPVCGMDFSSGRDMGDHLIVEHQWEESDFEQFEEGRANEVSNGVKDAINMILEDNMSISEDELVIKLQSWDYSDSEIREGMRNYYGEAERKVSPSSFMKFTEPLQSPTGKVVMDQTYGTSEPETADGQDLTGKSLRRKGTNDG